MISSSNAYTFNFHLNEHGLDLISQCITFRHSIEKILLIFGQFIKPMLSKWDLLQKGCTIEKAKNNYIWFYSTRRVCCILEKHVAFLDWCIREWKISEADSFIEILHQEIHCQLEMHCQLESISFLQISKGLLIWGWFVINSLMMLLSYFTRHLLFQTLRTTILWF